MKCFPDWKVVPRFAVVFARFMMVGSALLLSACAHAGHRLAPHQTQKSKGRLFYTQPLSRVTVQSVPYQASQNIAIEATRPPNSAILVRPKDPVTGEAWKVKVVATRRATAARPAVRYEHFNTYSFVPILPYPNASVLRNIPVSVSLMESGNYILTVETSVEFSDVPGFKVMGEFKIQ